MLGELLDFSTLLYVTTAVVDVRIAISNSAFREERLGKVAQAAEPSVPVTANFLDFNGSFLLTNRKVTDLEITPPEQSS